MKAADLRCAKCGQPAVNVDPKLEIDGSSIEALSFKCEQGHYNIAGYGQTNAMGEIDGEFRTRYFRSRS